MAKWKVYMEIPASKVLLTRTIEVDAETSDDALKVAEDLDGNPTEWAVKEAELLTGDATLYDVTSLKRVSHGGTSIK